MNHSQSPQSVSLAELRKFGLLLGVLFVLFFSVFLPWVKEAKAYPVWPAYVAAVLFCLALLAPGAIKPIFIGWNKIGAILGAINSRVILGAVFVFIFIPIGLIWRLTGKDPLKLKGGGRTYKVISETPPINQMEKPI